MQSKLHLVRIQEVLTERKEKPDLEAILNGEVPIVAKIRFDTGKIELREESHTKTNMILIRPGDLVISGINAAKGAIAIYGKENPTPAAATIHYSSYIVNQEKADLIYLWHFMRSNIFKKILISSLPEGIKTEVKPGRLLPIEIPLIPLEEQKRVVATIEKLMANIERARTLRAETVKDALKLFLSTLEAIFGEDGLKKWPRKKLADDGLAFVVAGQHILASEYNSTGDGFPYLTGPADFGSKIPIVKRWTHTPKSSALPGDILLTVKGAGVGKINFAPDFEVAIGRQIMAIRPDPSKILREYVYFFLEYRFKYFQSIATATTVPGFKKSDVEKLKIPAPALLEQRHIVAYLNSLEEKMDELTKLQDETEKEVHELIQSVLDKAFKGEL